MSGGNAALRARMPEDRRAFQFIIFLGLISALTGVGQAYLIASVVNASLEPSDQLIYWCTSLAAVLLFRGTLSSLQVRCRFRFAERLRAHLREKVFSHLLQIGPIKTKRWSTGQLTALLMEHIEALHNYYAEYRPQHFLSVIVPLLLALVILVLNPICGIIVLVTAPLIPLFIILIGKKAGEVSRAQFKAMGKMSTKFLDSLQGLATLRRFDQVQAECDRISTASSRFQNKTMEVLKVAFLSNAVLTFFSSASIAAVAVFCGFTLLGHIHIGPAIDFHRALWILILAPEVYMPLFKLSEHYHAKASADTASDALVELLDIAVPKADTPSVALEQPVSIRFDNVNYSYPDQVGNTLSNCSFEVPANAHTAIIGPSGVGKSTVLRMLMRYLCPDSGQIMINDHPLAHYDLVAWRAQVAVVSQKVFLFPGTLRSNLLLAYPPELQNELTPQNQSFPLDEQSEPMPQNQSLPPSGGKVRMGGIKPHLMNILDQVALTDWITSLPNGLDTEIHEQNIGLSGGQARRIGIAQAMLKHAPVVLLDEPTASLDKTTQAEIIESLKQLCKGRTVITVTHKPEIMALADHIIDLREVGGQHA